MNREALKALTTNDQMENLVRAIPSHEAVSIANDDQTLVTIRAAHRRGLIEMKVELTDEGRALKASISPEQVSR